MYLNLLHIISRISILFPTETVTEVITETSSSQETTTAEEVTNVAVEAIDKFSEKSNSVIESFRSLEPKIFDFLISCAVAFVILLIGKLVIKLVMKFLDKIFERGHADASVRKFMHSVIKVLLYILLLIVVLGTVGVQTTSFIAVLSTAGVAIGLALQGALSNVAGGVLILILRPFSVGDFIIEEMNNGVEGTVKKIDIFYTSLTTIDNKVILIPNGTLINSRIINATKNDKRRIDFNVGISYDSDIKKAKEIMWSVVNEVKDYMKEEESSVFVLELAESQVTMQARFWVPTEAYWKTVYFINERMKEKLEEGGIVIPYNQLDVHIVSNDGK